MKCLLFVVLVLASFSFEIHGSSLAPSFLEKESCIQGYYCEDDRPCGRGFCTEYRKCNCGVRQNPSTPSPINTLIPIFKNCVEGIYCIKDWNCGGGVCVMDEKMRFQSGYSMRTHVIFIY